MRHSIHLALGLLLLTVFLSGCANVQLKSADRAATKTVSIVRTSHYPEPNTLFYYTLGQNMAGALGGVVGAVIAHGASEDDRTVFCKLLKDQRIDVGQIIADRFEARLAAAKLFKIGTPSDADFRFQIRLVGAGIQGPFSPGMRPVLAANGQLINRQGRIIWQRLEQVTMLSSPAPASGLRAWLAHPETLRAGFVTIADKLANGFVADLHKP